MGNESEEGEYKIPPGAKAGDEILLGSDKFVVPFWYKECGMFNKEWFAEHNIEDTQDLTPAEDSPALDGNTNEDCEYEVMVPTGVMAGEEISFLIGSNTFAVVVPDGVREGESFRMVLASENLQHLLSQQDAEEKILDKQTRQDLEMRITRIRNTRALKKSKQAGKRKQKKFARTRRTSQWNIDPE